MAVIIAFLTKNLILMKMVLGVNKAEKMSRSRTFHSAICSLVDANNSKVCTQRLSSLFQESENVEWQSNNSKKLNPNAKKNGKTTKNNKNRSQGVISFRVTSRMLIRDKTSSKINVFHHKGSF